MFIGILEDGYAGWRGCMFIVDIVRGIMPDGYTLQISTGRPVA
jgi:hypothetical protein